MSNSVINISLTYHEISDLVSWLKDEHVRCRRNGITPSPGLTSALDYLELIDIGRSLHIQQAGTKSTCPLCRSDASTAFRVPDSGKADDSAAAQGDTQLDLADVGLDEG